jgi:hypothetical protein
MSADVLPVIGGLPVIEGMQALRAWLNGRSDLVGLGRPLADGAFTIEQASPSDGAYAVLASLNPQIRQVFAEDQSIITVRISFNVFAGTRESAGNAAAALRCGIDSLRGCPEACGDYPAWVHVSDNVVGPMFIPPQPGGGEEFCFNVSADFVLEAGN